MLAMQNAAAAHDTALMAQEDAHLRALVENQTGLRLAHGEATQRTEQRHAEFELEQHQARPDGVMRQMQANPALIRYTPARPPAPLGSVPGFGSGNRFAA